MKRPSEHSHLIAEPEDVFCRTKRQNIALYYSMPGPFEGAEVAQIRAWRKGNLCGDAYSVKSIYSLTS